MQRPLYTAWLLLQSKFLVGLAGIESPIDAVTPDEARNLSTELWLSFRQSSH
jgi:hypothetical protein